MKHFWCALFDSMETYTTIFLLIVIDHDIFCSLLHRSYQSNTLISKKVKLLAFLCSSTIYNLSLEYYRVRNFIFTQNAKKYFYVSIGYGSKLQTVTMFNTWSLS